MTLRYPRDLAALKHQIETESTDGRALARNLAENPICTVTRDESAQCLFVRWKKYATSAQVRYIHECLIDLIKRYRLSRILGDATALVTIDGEDQDWIIQEWTPRALAAGLRTVASKGPNGYYGRMAAARIQTILSRKLAVRSFDDLAAAREWLCGVQPH
jgi:hypothetical protein